MQRFGIMAIDVGQQHMAISLKIDIEKAYKMYLFSFHDNQKNETIYQKLVQLSKNLEEIYNIINAYCIETYNQTFHQTIKNIYIERQIVESNSTYQYAIMMWFAVKQIPIVTQLANQKYKYLQNQPKENTENLTQRQLNTNKILGQYYIMNNFIDKDMVEIVYQSNFGKNSSKHNKTGGVRLQRFYTENTKLFVQKNDLDKLDDIADTILMILSSQK